MDGPIDLDRTPDTTGAARDEVSFPVPPYDPSRDRERKRGQIALYLIGLLFVICLVPGALLVAAAACSWRGGGAGCGGIAVAEVERLTQLFLTPVVGLVGAVTGFYFGEKG